MKFFRYLKQLILSDSKESSKRFLAISTGLAIILGTFIYTTTDNWFNVLSMLCAFVLSLVGVTTWQAIKKENGKDRQ